MLEYGKITVLLGAIIFSASGFLPLVSFGNEYQPSLFGLYAGFGQVGQQIAAAVFGFFLTLILYPIAVIIGFLGFLKRRLALTAGILGIICWIIPLMTINGIQAATQLNVQQGYGIYAGMVEAIIMLVGYVLQKLGLK